jgi:hypothetical protein
VEANKKKYYERGQQNCETKKPVTGEISLHNKITMKTGNFDFTGYSRLQGISYEAKNRVHTKQN